MTIEAMPGSDLDPATRVCLMYFHLIFLKVLVIVARYMPHKCRAVPGLVFVVESQRRFLG